MIKAALALLLAGFTAAVIASGAAAAPQVLTLDGPFDSSFVDAEGIAQDAVCDRAERTVYDDGSATEVAFCRLLPGAALPVAGPVTYYDTTSHYDFWSDYIYETENGRLTLARTWSVTIYADGSIVAHSTYAAPDDDDDDDAAAGVAMQKDRPAPDRDAGKPDDDDDKRKHDRDKDKRDKDRDDDKKKRDRNSLIDKLKRDRFDLRSLPKWR